MASSINFTGLLLILFQGSSFFGDLRSPFFSLTYILICDIHCYTHIYMLSCMLYSQIIFSDLLRYRLLSVLTFQFLGGHLEFWYTLLHYYVMYLHFFRVNIMQTIIICMRIYFYISITKQLNSIYTYIIIKRLVTVSVTNLYTYLKFSKK